MPGIRHPLMINGVPVVTAPAEIDVTTAEQLRLVLLRPAARKDATAGLTVLVRAYKRAVADGGELRLVIPAGGAVARIFAITRLDSAIPLFGSLDEALAARPAAVTRPSRPQPSAGRRLARQPGLPGRRI